jgi:hypothetical protein
MNRMKTANIIHGIPQQVAAAILSLEMVFVAEKRNDVEVI